jgi:ABC-type proline/glycine betaine transport system substrate-binding protein
MSEKKKLGDVATIADVNEIVNSAITKRLTDAKLGKANAGMAEGEAPASSGKIEWETLHQSGGTALAKLQRAKVRGGWLVSSGADPHVVFVPDEKHRWLDDIEPKTNFDIIDDAAKAKKDGKVVF